MPRRLPEPGQRQSPLRALQANHSIRRHRVVDGRCRCRRAIPNWRGIRHWLQRRHALLGTHHRRLRCRLADVGDGCRAGGRIRLGSREHGRRQVDLDLRWQKGGNV